MQIIDIPIHQGQWITQRNGRQVYKRQWLSDALFQVLGHGYIPTNVILKKTLPGLGATYGEINTRVSPRHSIIIEPNVPVILGKTKGKPELLAIKEGCTVPKIKKYLNDNNILYKKLLTTPESFWKIKEACKQLNINIYNYFFCLFDECEKIVQDVAFREDITQPINDFFNFTNKAFVSATPVKMSHPEFKNQGFKILEIKPQYNYKKNLDLIITNNYEMEVTIKINALRNSDCVCVFLNKTDSIEKLVHTLGIKNQSKIFCSYDSVKKLKRKNYTNVFDQIDLPLAKYNFFTCRFFSAVDIEIQQKPDILMLTNLNEAIHTRIDPFTEAIQIYGRFRDKYHKGQIPFNSLTHITNIKPSMVAQTRAEVRSAIQASKRAYDNINNLLQSETDPTAKKTLEKDLKKLTHAELLDDGGNINHFSLDNLYYAEEVKALYTNAYVLGIIYQYTGHFNVNMMVSNQPVSSTFQSADLSAWQKREQIVLRLEELQQIKANNPTSNIEPFKAMLRLEEINNKGEMGELIVDAFYYLGGKTAIENIGYAKPKVLKKATDREKAKRKEKQLFPDILAEVMLQYQIGQTDTKNNIRDFLKEVYRLKGIDISVTQTAIEKYCVVTSNNRATPPTYTIRGYK